MNKCKENKTQQFMWFSVKPTSIGKDWKIILLTNENLQKWEKLSKLNNLIHQIGSSLEHSSKNSLKSLELHHLQLLSNVGWITNAFCFSIYRRGLQYGCMEKTWPSFNFNGLSVDFGEEQEIKFHASACNCSQKLLAIYISFGADFSTIYIWELLKK